MKRKIVKRLTANWAASFLSVVLLLSMAAAPVVASVTANTVGSPEIIDRSIKAVDIATGAIKKWKLADSAVTSKKIKDGGIYNRDIRPGVISSSRIRDGAILNRDIRSNVISSSRIRNGTILNTDIAAGAAISDSKISYATKTKNLSLPAAAFTPASNNANYANFGYLLMPASPSSSGTWVAPVSLPDGAKITKVRLDSYDASAGADMDSGLIRFNYSANTPTAMATVSSSGNLASWQHPADSTIVDPVIDNINNNYIVMVSAGTGGLALGGMLVTYQVNGP